MSILLDTLQGKGTDDNLDEMIEKAAPIEKLTIHFFFFSPNKARLCYVPKFVLYSIDFH